MRDFDKMSVWRPKKAIRNERENLSEAIISKALESTIDSSLQLLLKFIVGQAFYIHCKNLKASYLNVKTSIQNEKDAFFLIRNDF